MHFIKSGTLNTCVCHHYRATSLWNTKVKAKLKEEITLVDKENGYAKFDIESKVPGTDCLCINMKLFVSAAIKRYFESRKRLHRESQPEHKERVSQQEKKRKSRSRRQRVSHFSFLILYNYFIIITLYPNSYSIDVKNSSEVERTLGGTSFPLTT